MEDLKLEFTLAQVLLSRAITNQTFCKTKEIKILLSDIDATREDIIHFQVKKKCLEDWSMRVTHLKEMIRTLTVIKALLNSKEVNSPASPHDAGSLLLPRLQYLNSNVIEPGLNRLPLNLISFTCLAVDQNRFSAIKQFSETCESGLPVGKQIVKTAEAMASQLGTRVPLTENLNDCLVAAMEALIARASLYFGKMHRNCLKQFEG